MRAGPPRVDARPRRRRPARRSAPARATGVSDQHRLPQPASRPAARCHGSSAATRPRQIASAYGVDRAACRRARRPRPHDRDHRGLLLAHHPTPTSTLLARLRAAQAESATARWSRQARTATRTTRRHAGLVHRAGARRRVGARDGAAREDRLRRRRQRRRGPRPGAQRGGRQASGRRRLEQLGHARELASKRRDQGAQLGVPAGPGAGHGRVVRLRRRRRQPGGDGQALGRLPRLQPAGDLGRRHQPGDRLGGPAAVGDRLGHDRAATGRAALGGRRSPATSSTGPAAAPATSTPGRPTRAGIVRLEGTMRASPTWRWSPIPRPACCSPRPTRSRTAAPRRRSRGSAAPACPRR